MDQPPELRNPTFVIDGGYLLHKVVWPKDATYYEIFQCYIKYIKNHFGNRCFVIFDGYLQEYQSTKNCERLRRSHSYKTPEVNINDSHVAPPVPQNIFLLNSKNKSTFILYLSEELSKEGFHIISCNEDADTFIIEKALERKLEDEDNDVVIVGQDIDLLVLLTHYAYFYQKPIYLLKQKIGKQSEKHYNQHSLKNPELNNIILFLHAFVGCDTTSSFAGKGKKNLQYIRKI